MAIDLAGLRNTAVEPVAGHDRTVVALLGDTGIPHAVEILRPEVARGDLCNQLVISGKCLRVARSFCGRLGNVVCLLLEGLLGDGERKREGHAVVGEGKRIGTVS